MRGFILIIISICLCVYENTDLTSFYLSSGIWSYVRKKSDKVFVEESPCSLVHLKSLLVPKLAYQGINNLSRTLCKDKLVACNKRLVN